MTDPSKVLSALQAQRSRDRTMIGIWHAGLGEAERARFEEFIEAFRANPAYKIPLLKDALMSDPVLGEGGAGFPDVNGESLSKFLRRGDRDPQPD